MFEAYLSVLEGIENDGETLEAIRGAEHLALERDE